MTRQVKGGLKKQKNGHAKASLDNVKIITILGEESEDWISKCLFLAVNNISDSNLSLRYNCWSF